MMNNWGGYPGWAWQKESFALVASDGRISVVVYTGGPHLRSEIEEYGNWVLDNLGIGDFERGIWVWQGRIFWNEEGEPVDNKFVIRKPTDEEWKQIIQGRCPWDEADWGIE